MILQILQRLIPINDTSPHTIYQDYGDSGKGGPRETKGEMADKTEKRSQHSQQQIRGRIKNTLRSINVFDPYNF